MKPLLGKLKLRHWIFLLLLIAAVIVLLPQTGTIKQSFSALRQADPAMLVLATVFTFLTYAIAAVTYLLLAHKRLRYPRTVLVQLASMFTNRLLPAGIGGMGTNYAYLRKNKHTQDQAATTVAANNLLGIIGHVMLLIILFLLFRSQIDSSQLTHHRFSLGSNAWVVVAVLAIVVGVTIYFWKRIVKHVAQISKLLLNYRKRPFHLSGALGSSMLLTICNVLSFYYCAVALHVSLSFAAMLIIFTFGVALGTSTPTPGGLGGVEAGLVAGLVAYKVPAADALAIVLAYRLISYWLTLAVGALAFVYANKKHYF